MDLGRRLKQARLDAGLSQRQLCGTEITRNMLSQIENGNARPSMDTLRYLAARLNRPVSYFLEENAVVSPNQTVMAQARAAWKAGHIGEAQQALKEYRPPDPVFDLEKELLETLATLSAARDAMAGGRQRYAAELLEKLGKRENGYCAAELERERLLLLAKVRPTLRRKVCRALPGLDDELCLRAADALERGDTARSAALLDAAEEQENPEWNFLRGEVYLAGHQYAQAAQCYHRAEEAYPDRTAARLEQCYRELEDYKQAYFYACKQKK